MDQITKHRLDEAVQKLISSISLDKVCELASSFHPDRKPCRIFADFKRGSYNVCFPVIFDTEESMEGEKWMVRIPLLPRLAFPEEKLRSEIATMKYLSEKTTIPIPRLHGYSIHVNNILGLPFMLLEYIEGDTLFGIRISELELSKKEHLYSQLADIYIQLHRQQFDRVGALTLDENDEHWVFAHNRPLTVDINEQEVSGRDICRYLPPERTFESTIDYVYMLTKVISNDFYRCPDSILDREDARFYLYSNFSSLAVLMEWVDPDLNHGPFVLMYGDLRPPNIVIDKDFNIVSILDWEFSHTIPVQMLVPPYWLTNEDVLEISRSAISSLLYKIEAFNFRRRVLHRENKCYNPQKKSIDDLPLYGKWKELRDMTSFLLPHGLLKPHYFSNVYWNVLDHVYYGGDRKQRVDTFYSLELREPEVTAVDTKMGEFEEFERRREELGIEQGHVLQPVTQEEVAEISRKIQEYRRRQEQTKDMTLSQS